MAKVTEDKRVWDALLRDLRTLVKREVDVGVISGEDHPTYSGTVAGLATLWHTGFSRDGVDFSSDFFDPLLDYNVKYNKEFAAFVGKNMALMIIGTISEKVLMERIGDFLADTLSKSIRAGEASISKDGLKYKKATGGVTMIDTSELVDAIDYEVR